MNLQCYGTQVEIERNGKKPERYTLVAEIMPKTYFAIKNIGRNPKQLYLVQPKKREFLNESF